MNLKDKTALFFDRGAWLPFAQALTGPKGFKTVYYYSTNSTFMTKSQEALIGRGFEGIERADSFWSLVDDVDVIVFPDVSDGDLQTYLRNKGYSVWGCGHAEMIELDRWQFRKVLEELGQPTPDTTRVIGMDALREELKNRTDVYLKTSFFRGDFETHHFTTYDIEKPWLDERELALGPHSKEIEVLIEEPIKGIEPGYDGYSILGKYPATAMWGWEYKDKAYLGKVSDFSTMPKELVDTCNALSMPLKTLGMMGNFHTEIRVGDEGVFILDPSCRAGSPPIETMASMIENWAEIVYHGARGELVEPEFVAKYGCQIILKSMWLLDNFLAINIPPDYEPFLKLRRGCKLDGKLFAVPSEDLELAGSAVGVGDTPQQACEMAEEIVSAVECLELEIPDDCCGKLMEMAKEGEKVFGEEF